MRAKPLYQLLASRLAAAQAVFPNIDESIVARNADELETLCREFMPAGSGFDSGTQLDLDACKPRKRMVFKTAFHHMSESGMYDCWTQHSVIIESDFDGFTIRVTGRDRNGIKDFIADSFHAALTQQIAFEWNKAAQEFEFSTTQGELV